MPSKMDSIAIQRRGKVACKKQKKKASEYIFNFSNKGNRFDKRDTYLSLRLPSGSHSNCVTMTKTQCHSLMVCLSIMPRKTSTERLGWGESPMEETFVSMFPYLSSSSILKEASIGRNGLRICSSLLWGPCLFVSNLDVETNRFCLEPISFLTRALLCLWTCKQAFEQMRNWIQWNAR